MDLYLSDLHLGNPLFKSEEEVVSLVNDTRFDRIFFVGDIIDVWEEELPKIEIKYQSLISTINDVIRKEKEVIFLKGNHDPDEVVFKYLFPRAKMFNDKFIENDVIVMHGNQFDGAILKVEFLNKLFYYTSVWPLQRIFRCNVRDRFRLMLTSVADRKGKEHYNRLVSQIEKDAVETYQKDFNYIIMGHTHFPKIVSCEDIDSDCQCDYINCGDWIHNKTYLIRDDDGKFHLEGDIRGT
jgi:UDP-2,3-diacylglucosamine pyrophosphatase LpxH